LNRDLFGGRRDGVLQRLRRRGVLRDPREADVPSAGLVALVDPETGEKVVADTARPEVRRALRAPGFEASEAVFKKTRVDALALDTGASYERPLSGFFKARERRR